jgi:hypothetical protein
MAAITACAVFGPAINSSARVAADRWRVVARRSTAL